MTLSVSECLQRVYVYVYVCISMYMYTCMSVCEFFNEVNMWHIAINSDA